MNKHLIKQVQARKACIVFGKGDSVVKLNKVLKACFPMDKVVSKGLYKYYWRMLKSDVYWINDKSNDNNLPEIKLADFFNCSGTTSIDITYKDITMEVTGDYYAGAASTSRDVPNDAPTFRIDTVTVGGVDICNLLDLEIIEELTLETLKA